MHHDQHTSVPITRKARGEAYLAWLDETLHDAGRFKETKREVRRAVSDYARANRASMGATWRGATWVLFRTLAAIVGPTALVWRLAAAGYGWLGLLLVPVTGAAMFGVTSIIHDTVHGTFAPARWANRLIGRVLAPLVLLDFESFHASHMGHHRHSQSKSKDPKNPKMPAPAARTNVEPSLSELPLELWFGAARAVKRLPSRLRHAFYLFSLMLLGLPVVVFFAGEVSFRERNFKRVSPWLSLLATVAIPVGLAVVSPYLAVFFVASLWFAMGLFFGVFLTHMSPYQLYMADDNTAVPFFSLNISDIYVNRAVEVLGNTFTEYHAAHHLFPYVPSYALAPVGRWVNEHFADWKAPTFRLTSPDEFNVLADSLVNLLTASGQTLIFWQTEAGELMRLTRVAYDEQDEAPASSQRFLPAAA